MSKPVILTVDDEAAVLNAVERDLRSHYQGKYRIIKAISGAAALDISRQLKARDEMIALFLVDQRMPYMSGTEFLAQVQRLYPDARKVLLTAYTDTLAAIKSINEIGLDYYLMKPWEPPELHLYPVLDDLLDDWWRAAEPPFDGIRVAGTLWSATSHETKEFLALNRIPYQWLDIESDAEAAALVEGVSQGQKSLPVVFFPDGEILFAPDNRQLAQKIGLQVQASQPYYDLIIIGGGPSGLGAAVYGASEGMRTALIEREATGGQAGTSSWIENYLGFPQGLSGAMLAQRATDQALRLGAEILTTQEVVGVRVEDPYRIVQLDDGSELSCRALVIATGVTVRKLDVPGAEPLTGAGIYYGAALTEAAHYRDEHVYVLGGANSAGQGAMFFSKYACQVTMVVRASTLKAGMSQYLVDQIQQTPHIKLLFRTEVLEALGDRKLTGLRLMNKDNGETYEVETPALFIFIGAEAHTEFLGDVIERNRAGFIPTGPDLIRDGKPPRGWPLRRDPYLLETSVPGIFAAGDVRQGAVRRVASAVGEGAIAVNIIQQYLKSV